MAYELVVLSSDIDAAATLAGLPDVAVVVDHRPDVDVPFRAFVRVRAERVDEALALGDRGAYFVCCRVAKGPGRGSGAPEPSVVTINALVGRGDLDPIAVDRAWRESHADLVRRHHPGVARYEQLPVVHRVAGPAYHGFAICSFDDLSDLTERFYDSASGRAAIHADIATFADVAASPRRLVATPIGPSSARSRGVR